MEPGQKWTAMDGKIFLPLSISHFEVVDNKVMAKPE
jgi:hypothetical protein